MSILLIPGGLPPAPGVVANPRTVFVPLGTCGTAVLRWPAKDPLDSFSDYRVDATAYCSALGRVVAAAVILGCTDASLEFLATTDDAAGITLHLAGGTTGLVAGVTVRFTYDNGDLQTVVVLLPVQSIVPAGSSPVSISSGGSGGTQASGTGITTVRTGAPVSGQVVLMPDGNGNVVTADPSSPSYQFAGISLQAAAVAGASIQVAEAGAIVNEPTWSWQPGTTLYVGAAGAITAIIPTTGTLQQVAVALTATSILVQPGQPFVL